LASCLTTVRTVNGHKRALNGYVSDYEKAKVKVVTARAALGTAVATRTWFGLSSHMDADDISLNILIKARNNDPDMAEKLGNFLLAKAALWRIADKVEESMKAVEEAQRAMDVLKLVDAEKAADDAAAESAAMKARAVKATRK